MSHLSTVDILLHKTHQCPSGGKVQRLNMCRSILSLSKIAHYMWCDHPFNQRNRTTERTVGVGVGVGGDREVGGEAGGQNLKKWGRQYRGVFIK